MVDGQKTRTIFLQRETEKMLLIMPGQANTRYDFLSEIEKNGLSGTCSYIDLRTGEMELDPPIKIDGPFLVIG